MFLKNKNSKVLSFSCGLGKLKALEIALYYGFDLLCPIVINLYIMKDCDHPGFRSEFRLFGIGIEFDFYDIRHREEIYGKEKE